MTDRRRGQRHDRSPGRRPGLVERLTDHLRYWRDVQEMDIPEAEEIARIAVKFINTETYSKPSPAARCSICASPLDVPGRPWTRDCGGHCLACMGEGDGDDLECEAAVQAMRAGEAVVRAAREVVNAAMPTWQVYHVVRADKLHALRDALPAERGEEG